MHWKQDAMRDIIVLAYLKEAYTRTDEANYRVMLTKTWIKHMRVVKTLTIILHQYQNESNMNIIESSASKSTLALLSR